jgi:methyl-accepting chemotaxis protein
MTSRILSVDLGEARTGRRGGSLRRALILRILGIGLVTILLSLVVLGLQIRRTAQQQVRDDVARQAALASTNVSALFNDWRNELLIAADNSAYQDWFSHPEDRAALHPRIDAALVSLHSLYPDLVDEACFIDARGPELARQVSGQPAPTAELSSDESGNPFFAPTFRLGTGQVWQASPYISPDSQRWVVSNSTPIVVAGRDVATVHFEVNLDGARTFLAHGLAAGMQARIVDTSTHSVIADTSVRIPIVKAPLSRTGTWRGAAGPVRTSSAIALGANNGNHWTVEISSRQAQPFTRALLLQALALLTLVTGLLAAAALHFSNGISRPVQHVTEVAEAMGSGDLTHRTVVHRNDEIGRMAESINQAIDAMQAQQETLREDYEARQEQLRDNQAAQRRSQEETRARAKTVIDETAASVRLELERLFEHVREVQAGSAAIDDRVLGTSAATRILVGHASHANKLVDSLRESLQKVGGIADLIGGVASQTNLLALNATIEAARAGQAGRGFSVVADEVKSLATETARSTREITATIAQLEQGAHAVTSAIATMADNVGGIDEATAHVSTVTAHQMEVVGQMEDVVQKAVDRISQMSDITENP